MEWSTSNLSVLKTLEPGFQISAKVMFLFWAVKVENAVKNSNKKREEFILFKVLKFLYAKFTNFL